MMEVAHGADQASGIGTGQVAGAVRLSSKSAALLHEDDRPIRVRHTWPSHGYLLWTPAAWHAANYRLGGRACMQVRGAVRAYKGWGYTLSNFGSSQPRDPRVPVKLYSVQYEVLLLSYCVSSLVGGCCLCAVVPSSRSVPDAWMCLPSRPVSH